MKIEVDPHTHTVASGHAYSTIIENATFAKKNGMKAIGITDHAHAMPGGAHSWHFWNLKNIPDYINGVRIIKGAEANILDDSGTLDIDELWDDYKNLELIIASVHDSCIAENSRDYITSAYINAIKRPCVKILGHPDRSIHDTEAVVRAAAQYEKIIEINNSSIKIGEAGIKNIRELLKYCKEYGVYVALSSDAHIALDIGNFDFIMPIISEVEFPKSLILNTSVENFMKMVI